MKGRITRSLFTILSALTVISACAKISSPSGGLRDREPPVVIKSNPPNSSTNFSGKRIVITFNEFVVLEGINEKLMVSPPMNSKPRVFIRGKNVNIEFEDELRDSTTYTFYFQDAIRDLNENNPLNNFQFVFSTGPVIDSLSVTGNVYNSYDLEVPESTIILLYSQLADSAVVKQLPDYITMVEDNGMFRINNVRPGTYRLYALKDLDNSKNYNLADEEFAFLNEPVEINILKNYLPEAPDTSTIRSEDEESEMIVEPEGEYKLLLFQAQKKNRYMTSSVRELPYQMIYTLSLPPDTMKFQFSIPDTDSDAYFIETSENRDTMTVWLTDSILYSQQQITTLVSYPFTDTAGVHGYKKDTLLMRYLAPRSSRAKAGRTPYRVSTGISSGFLRPDQGLILRSQTPFRPTDTSRLKLYEISDNQRVPVPYSLLMDSTNSCRYFMNTDLQQGKDYLFIADSAAFGNIYGDYSDSTGVKFSLRTPESYGNLNMNITNPEGNIIIQLLDNTEKLVREVFMTSGGTVEFPLLEKGFYRLRAIYDLNGDGKWTTGDFSTGRQPEPVSYFPEEHEIRVNWTDNEDWDLQLKNVKNPALRKTRNPRR